MEPTEAVARWQRWAVRGDPSQLDDVVESIGHADPSRWERVEGPPPSPSWSTLLVRSDSIWYVLKASDKGAGVTVSLERPSGSELRGGWVWPVDRSRGDAPAFAADAWGRVIEFLEEGVVPAARKAGADVFAPSRSRIFEADLPTEVQSALAAFSGASNRSLPLNDEASAAWQGFVVAAFRSGDAIDPEELLHWLTDDGWALNDAGELKRRFLDEYSLLYRFTELTTV